MSRWLSGGRSGSATSARPAGHGQPRSFALLLGWGALVLMLATGAQGQGGDAPPQAPGEVMIQFAAGVPPDRQAEVRARVGAVRQQLIRAESQRDDGKGDLELAKLPPGVAVTAAVEELESAPEVLFAEPNWTYQPLTTGQRYREHP